MRYPTRTRDQAFKMICEANRVLDWSGSGGNGALSKDEAATLVRDGGDNTEICVYMWGNHAEIFCRDVPVDAWGGCVWRMWLVPSSVNSFRGVLENTVRV